MPVRKSPKRRSPKRKSPAKRRSPNRKSPKRGSPKSCPSGKILKAGYYRKAYTRADGTRVKAIRVPPTCIKDVGLKGKGPKILPTPKEGLLKKHGYSLSASTNDRRKALRKAMRSDGGLSVLRHLNLRRNFIKRSQPANYKKMSDDLKYVQKLYHSGIKA